MDHLKPQYHYMPEKNWMNDPVGLYFDGQWYHMFYQYNPHGDQWGSIHWGHCRSKDLLHWEERPVALAPHIDQGEQHCFSGSLVVSDRKNPLIFYTRIPFGKKAVSHNAEQWVARGDENLENWPHSGKTPLITNSIHGETDRVIDWRDPFVFRAYNHWYMLLGGSLNGDGVILLYRSEDLENWTYRCILLTDSEEAPFLECPNLILDNEKAILLYSPANKPVRYMTGEFTEEERFIADHQSILDNSAMEGLYAPQMARDKEESIYMIGWAPEESRSNSSIIRGYSGAQTLPRRITIEDDGSLNIAPHRICETLRKTHRQLLCQNQKQSEILINEKGRQWELCLDMDLNPENKKKNIPLTIRFYENQENEESTEIRFERNKNRLILDRSQSTSDLAVNKSTLFIPLEEEPQSLSLRVFADGSLIELYLNRKYCLTGRVYPTADQWEGIKLFCYGKNVKGDYYSCAL